MREYIVQFQNNWWHFFIKQNTGLCIRKKDGFKFGENEVLLKGAESDFCVFATEESIHIVCQDGNGSVLYLVYDGVSWKKRVLLHSKTARPYKKYFQFVSLSGHINILYVIENKERLLLVHQTLSAESVPFVVDYIAKSDVPFCIASHEETDFTLFYKNEKGKSGYKRYKWSQKTYSGFEEFDKDDVEIRFAEVGSSGNLVACAVSSDNIMQISFDEQMNKKEEIKVTENCLKDAMPIISHYGDKKYIVWTEYGGIVASHFESGVWSKPVRYAKSNQVAAILYVIYHNGKCEYFYGAPRENDIILYGTHDFLKTPPKNTSKNSTEFFGENSLKELTEQVKKIYEELSIQRRKLSYLSEKIAEIVSNVPIADEEDIDKILLN